MQVSRSKKWESKVALDEQGNPLLTSKGKKVLRTSYSVLQDDFFNYMKAAGYTDVERGERGSTEEHLTVTQFKVAQEQQRLEDVTAQIAQTEQALDTAQAAVEKKTKRAAIPAKADQRTAHCRPDRTGNPLHGEKDDLRQYRFDPIRVQHTQRLCGQWDSCQGRKQPFGGKATTSEKERHCLETAIRVAERTGTALSGSCQARTRKGAGFS